MSYPNWIVLELFRPCAARSRFWSHRILESLILLDNSTERYNYHLFHKTGIKHNPMMSLVRTKQSHFSLNFDKGWHTFATSSHNHLTAKFQPCMSHSCPSVTMRLNISIVVKFWVSDKPIYLITFRINIL